MAKITGVISDNTLQRLRHYLINTEGSTKKMGAFLEEIIAKALDEREGEQKGNGKSLSSTM